jgi:cell division protein FtsI (penicillin-binding protein 3)
MKNVRGRGRRRDRALVPTDRARRARLALLAAAVAFGFAALALRCLDLQVLRAASLVSLANAQHDREITLDPRRGPILDRNGNELAMSLEVDSVYADPSEIEDAGAAARRLAPVLGMKPGELKEKLDSDRRFVWLRRKIDPDLRKRVESLDLRGVAFVRESKRYYPKQDLAAHMVGSCGLDNQGLAGLEYAFNERFTGTPGRLEFLRDGRGRSVLDRSRVDPVPGDGMQLTIDENVQHIAERELDQAMKETNADGATIVVLRPQTGEVLALANRPGFDPNDFGKASESARHDRAVSDFYEPGSTFKVITAAAALDAGKVRPNEVIYCENGSYFVARHRFHEDRLPFGDLTFTDVLAKSSNIGTIKVAQRMSSPAFLDAIRRFGFGRSTALELPGESPGLLEKLNHWSGLSHASIAMGQEIGVTPIQLAAALGAIANDGVYNPPHVIASFLSPDGSRKAPERDPDDVPHRAVSADTARTLRQMLMSVTTDGTGKAAQVSGYTTGGKTGTAQKIDPATRRYMHGKYVAWFAGFVPAASPALVLVVMVDEPRGAKTHGGEVAAPVFSRVAEPVLRYLGVPPDRDGTLVIDPSLRAAAPQGDRAVAATLRLRAAGPDRAVGPDRPAAPDRAGAAGRAPSSATAPHPPLPVRASVLPMPLTVSRQTEGGDNGFQTMPDLTGLSLRQATEALAGLGLSCSSQRGGPRVARQTPEPGAPIVPGTRCTVFYE